MSESLYGFDPGKSWEYENGYFITSHVTRLAKSVAHYELYKSIVDLPGDVVECGVFKGASFIRLLTFREMLESPFSRKVIGFDAFGKFPQQASDEDQKFVEMFERDAGKGISEDELNKVLLSKGFKNYELIKGDILETVPRFATNFPERRIALLHIDVDVYTPSLVILNELYERVVEGGLIILDDYGTVAGETLAVDEFFKDKGQKIGKLPISHIPAYIRKSS